MTTDPLAWLHDPPAPDDWREQAACLGQDPAMWFPTQGDPGHAAKAVCRTCPVVAPCLELGLGEDSGVFGGLNEGERRRLRRGRALAAGRRAS